MMMGMSGSSVIIFVIGSVIGLVVETLSILLGIRVGKVENGTFGKAVLCALLIAIINLIAGYFMGHISVIIRIIISTIISAIVAIFVIKGVLKITYKKAFVVWIVSLIPPAILFFIYIIFVIFIIGAAALLSA